MADKEKSVLPKRTTDYDGLVKQIMNNMQDKNIIEFIGALFSKKYTKDSQLIRLCTETHDENATQRRADFYLKVDNDFYNIEVQSREDKFMALRIFEYGIRGAMQHGQQTEDDDTINLDFPEPVVIYLRKGKNVHNEHKVNLNLPGYDEPVVYKAKVRYVSDYTIQDMIDQKCYPLIPFFPMRFEDEISKIHDASFEESMNRNICDLVNRLRNQVKMNELMIKDYIYITNAMGKIYGGLVSKSKSENTLIDEKGVKQTMDTILDDKITFFDIYEFEKQAKAEGKAEGRAEGRAEGIEKHAIFTANVMLQNGETDKKIMQYTNLSQASVSKLRAKYEQSHSDKQPEIKR